MFIPRAQPHAEYLFLFPIVFGINLLSPPLITFPFSPILFYPTPFLYGQFSLLHSFTPSLSSFLSFQRLSTTGPSPPMSDRDRAMMYRLQANQAKLDLQESFVLFTSNVRKTRSQKGFSSTKCTQERKRSDFFVCRIIEWQVCWICSVCPLWEEMSRIDNVETVGLCKKSLSERLDLLVCKQSVSAEGQLLPRNYSEIWTQGNINFH